jgi:hypothetical protein
LPVSLWQRNSMSIEHFLSTLSQEPAFLLFIVLTHEYLCVVSSIDHVGLWSRTQGQIGVLVFELKLSTYRSILFTCSTLLWCMFSFWSCDPSYFLELGILYWSTFISVSACRFIMGWAQIYSTSSWILGMWTFLVIVKVVSTNDTGPDNETFFLTYFLSMCFVSKDLKGKTFCFLDLSLVVCHLWSAPVLDP